MRMLILVALLAACGDNLSDSMTNRDAAELVADEGCRRKIECDTLYIGTYQACFNSLLAAICRDNPCDDRSYERGDELLSCIETADARTCEVPNLVCGL